MSEKEYKFKPGDVVRLKSSNLKMTVTKNITSYFIDGPPRKEVKCIWFDKNDEYHEKYFIEEVLCNTKQKP